MSKYSAEYMRLAQENAAKRRSGEDITAGLSFGGNVTKEEFLQRVADTKAAKEKASAAGVDTAVTTTTDASTTGADTTTPDTSLSGQLSTLQAQQTDYASQMADAIRSTATTRSSAYESLFGSGSTIASFYNPSIQSIEQQITDITETMRKLDEDVLEENKDVGLTDAQARRITAKRSGELSDTLAAYTSSYEKLTAGKAAAMELATAEYDMLMANAQDEVNATITELTQKSDLTADQISEIKTQLEDQLATEKDTKSSVDKILEDARNLIYAAGITPTAAFDKVVKDAYAMAGEGASVADIENGIYRALESNPAIKAYIATNAQFDLYGKPKTSSGSSSDKSSYGDFTAPSSSGGSSSVKTLQTMSPLSWSPKSGA